MDPCLCGYRIHSNEEKNQGLVKKIWLVNKQHWRFSLLLFFFFFFLLGFLCFFNSFQVLAKSSFLDNPHI